ncbi:hypothetical protein ACVBAX_08795 [Robertmurraya sp. GLU-23]
MRKLLLLLFIITIVLVGCSIGGKSKPEDVRQEVWDDGIQMTIAINESVKNEKPSSEGVFDRMRAWEEEKELSKKEEEISDKISDLVGNSAKVGISLFFGDVDKEIQTEYEESYKNLEEIFGKSNLSAENLDTDFVQTLEMASEEKDKEQMESKKKDFIATTNISVTADEVQYNMPNNLDKEFYLEGTIELCDYYNYGFTYEEDYFCGQLTPFDGGYSDSWYLYFDRDSFDGVYDLLLERNIDLRVSAEIPEYMYEKGQGKMAYVKRTSAY